MKSEHKIPKVSCLGPSLGKDLSGLRKAYGPSSKVSLSEEYLDFLPYEQVTENVLSTKMCKASLTRGFICLLFLISGIQGGSGLERLPRITEHPSNVTVPRNDPVTLKCGAEGHPDPDLLWYKDGIRVQPSTHRVFLPTGALFFLRVTQNKKESDAGVYWCEAVNRAGRVRSKNASLEIAFLRDDFRTSPTGGRVVAGERAELDCVPPRSYPPAEVSWEKNGNSVVMNDRVYAESGKLIIRETLQTDEGRYTCIASNRIGSRTSKSAILAVLVRPFFVRLPGDVTGVVGMNARLECRAGGAPRPNVLWRRHDGRMPLGRARMAEDNALIITSLVTEDAGVYICQAENDVATVVANATLTVRDPPSVEIGPKDTALLTNDTLQLPCKGDGAPSPVPIWTIAGKPKPFSLGWTSLWARIKDDGTLEIKPQSEEDGGFYTCLLLSESGGAHVSSYITVVNHQNAPPPSFTTRPENQTLHAKEPGTLHCRARGPPDPRITWHRGPTLVRIDNNRIKMTKEGDLFFEELQPNDSGTYSCIATSSTGESRAMASLAVLGTRSSFQERNVVRQMDPLELPPAPSRPRLISLSNANATFSWRPGQLKKRASNDRATILDYSIEVSVEGGPWQTVAKSVATTSHTLKLALGMAHIFVVRARGTLGESPPSPWSPLIIGGKEDSHVELERPMKNALLNLTSVFPASSRALKITWQVTEEGRELDGLYVHFRPVWKPIHSLHLTHSQPRSLLPHSSSSSSSYSLSPPFHSGSSEVETRLELHPEDYTPWGTVTVLNAGASSYVLTRLSPNTVYQVFLVPFKGAHSGVPSAMLTNATDQEAPAGPPTEVSVRLLNISVARLTWHPPEPRLIHGIITHFRILVFVNETSIFLNKTVSSSTFSYQVASIIPGHTYSISVSAISKKGSGPPSQPIRLQTDPSLLNPLANRHARKEGVVGEAWFFIVLVGVAMFFLLLVLVILLSVRRYSYRASKLPTLNGSVTKTSNLANFYGGENLWPDAGWHDNADDMKPDSKHLNNSSGVNGDILASLASEYAEIDSFGTFAGNKIMSGTSSEVNAEAYATATLLSSGHFRRNKIKNQNDKTRVSQDVLNNTDSEEKHLLDSKRPFFIETSTPPIVPPTPSTFYAGGSQFKCQSRGATLGPYAQGITGIQNDVSPYSVNTFASQPHLLQKGITLNLRNLAPPPPDHPPPSHTIGHLRHNFTRTKTMEELPYACYSATRLISPMLARATSLEGRSSPYAPTSSATYQSIEGLTEGLQEFNEEEVQGPRCNNCGSRDSTMSSSMKILRPHHHNLHHHGNRHNCNHHQRNHMLQSTLEKNHHNSQINGGYASGVSISSSQHCCKTPILGDFESTSCSYTPNFYGWMSPPSSPKKHCSRGTSFECECASLDGNSIYGGSVRSDLGGEYGYGKGGSSFHSSSVKSLNIKEENTVNSEDSEVVESVANEMTEDKVPNMSENVTVSESDKKKHLVKDPPSTVPDSLTPTKNNSLMPSPPPELCSVVTSCAIKENINPDDYLIDNSFTQTDVEKLLASCDKQTKL